MTESGAAPPLAVVTGASRGIGFALARELARRGCDLVIAASSRRVEEAAAELRRFEAEPGDGASAASHLHASAGTGVRVEAVQVDLTTTDGVQRLWERVLALDRAPAIVALNAGCGVGGAFADTDLERDLAVIDLNVRATVQLAKLAVAEMHAAGRGRLLLTSSIAASMPGPFQASYNASKSFVQSFGLALRNELRGSGVSVTVLMPGPTDTGFFARNAMDDTRIASGRKDDPADVARDAVDGLLEGRERVVSASLLTKLQQAGTSVLPDAVTAELVRHMAEPGSASR
jgi:short-subunit dehydrogenase